MAFDWRDLLDFTTALHRKSHEFSNEEAALRTAVSRAYFAAYNHAYKIATDHLGFLPAKSYEDHYELRRHLAQHGHRTAADKLHQLRLWRNECDYNDRSRDFSSEAAGAIYQAGYIFNAWKPKKP